MSVAVVAAFLALADPQSSQTSPPAPQPPPSTDTAVSGVVVSAEKPNVDVQIDRRSYSVAKDLNATTGSMVDVLRNIPSVSIDTQGNVSLRGDTSVTILIDGRPPGGSAAQILQSLPADRVDRVEVMTNPPPEFQADGSGGIINLISKKATGAGDTGSARVAAADKAIYSLTLNHSFNSDKLSVTEDAHYLHNATRLGREQDEVDTNPVALITDRQEGDGNDNQIDGHLGLDYDATAKDRLSLQMRAMSDANPSMAIGHFDEQNAAGQSVVAYDRLETGHQLVRNFNGGLTWKHSWAQGHDLTFGGNFNTTEIRQTRIEEDEASPTSGAFAQSFDRVTFLRQPEFRADYQQGLPGKATLKLGYQFDYNASRLQVDGGQGADPATIAPDASRTDHFVDDTTDHQAYASYQRPFGPWTILAGLRAETVHLDLTQETQGGRSSQDYARLYPNLRAAYDLGDGQTFTASLTRRIIRQQVIDLDPFQYLARPNLLIRGNPDLKPQDVSSFELSYDRRKGANSFLATLYYRQRNNYITEELSDLGNGVLSDQEINAGHLYTGGGEIAASRQVTSKVSFNLSADAYWQEVNAPGVTPTPVRTLWTGFGHASVTWQITPKNTLQADIFLNGVVLQANGQEEPAVSGNIGFRHVINKSTSWTVTAKDPFRTLIDRVVYDTSAGRTHVEVHPDNRMFVFALVKTFGGKADRPDFGFNPGGSAGSSGVF